MSARGRTILHLDLDAFFASVEQLDDPALRGRPVIVGGTSRRGVVCAASYEARRFGVRSAMPTAQAHRLCPGGVFLEPRFERYAELSHRVFETYRRYTPEVEPLSLDEAFLDVTASRALHGDGRAIAARIRAEVRAELGLAVSAGVAEVKLAAKIATDLGKPDGLVVVEPGTVRAFLAPLPVGRLWGVGDVTESSLRRIGVATIGDLAAMPESALAAAIGASHAHGLAALARGEDPREVIAGEEAKSVGAEETFDRDLCDRPALERALLEQAGRVARRLRAHGLAGDVVTVKVKYSDFSLVTRRVTLPHPTDDDGQIWAAARAQLARVELDRPIRLTGVSVSGFVGPARAQLDLFGGAPPPPAAAAPAGSPPAAGAASPPGSPAKRRALNAALDALSERFGERVVRRADLVEGEGKARGDGGEGDGPGRGRGQPGAARS